MYIKVRNGRLIGAGWAGLGGSMAGTCDKGAPQEVSRHSRRTSHGLAFSCLCSLSPTATPPPTALCPHQAEDPDLPAFYYDPLIHPIAAYRSDRWVPGGSFRLHSAVMHSVSGSHSWACLLVSHVMLRKIAAGRAHLVAGPRPPFLGSGAASRLRRTMRRTSGCCPRGWSHSWPARRCTLVRLWFAAAEQLLVGVHVCGLLPCSQALLVPGAGSMDELAVLRSTRTPAVASL